MGRPRSGRSGLAVNAHGLSGTLADRDAKFCKAVLLVIVSLTTALAFQGFFIGPVAGLAVNMGYAKWVYLAVAASVGAAVVIHEQCRRWRTYVFASATAVFGASFVVLDYQASVGGSIVLTALAAAGLIGGLEFVAQRSGSIASRS